MKYVQGYEIYELLVLTCGLFVYCCILYKKMSAAVLTWEEKFLFKRRN